MPEFDPRVRRNTAPGEDYYARQAETMESQARDLAVQDAHPLDGEEARKQLRKLLEWFYFEKDKQAANRLEMAMDADFYDGIQWDPADAQVLNDRGQMALVFNELAPMIDWIIGTERRTRVDWRVMPRTEDDVQLADIKTKALKYLSDVNRVQYNRSRAFSDAMKAGVGWLDSGVRDDPTAETIYNRVEDWRNVLWDSAGYELDLIDSRYLFRWRWVDEDIAVMMFPDREAQIRMAVNDSQFNLADSEEDTWYTMDEHLNATKSGTLRASGVGLGIDAKRRRVKLIECQFRKPVSTKIVGSGPMKGAFFDERDSALVNALGAGGGSIIDKNMMRVHVAVFTEGHLLSIGPSIFRHNRFSLTPVWAYRRGRDRLPYGPIRRVRDVQMDLNKRASKASWLMSTNQVIADEGATDDWENLREEAAAPDGLIIKKQGKEVTIRRDSEAAVGQIQLMTLNAQSIQKSAGVSQENMGRQTNAVSGEAIKARQLQGSVVTTELFDNLRLATQIDGEKQLSLSEQFMTEEKVIRLTGAKGAIEWVKLNQPEVQPDGTLRFINDITASMADFVVSEADYTGTLRQVMFESLNQMAGRLPPEVALRMLTMAMEFSDFPNKDEIAAQIRKITGDRDPSKEPSPEEQQQMQQQQAQQQQAIEMQRQQALGLLEEQRAKVRELNAKAAKLEADVARSGQDPAQAEALALRVRQQASAEIDRLTEQLRQVTAEAQAQVLKVRTDADSRLEEARIQAEGRKQVAEIAAESNERIAAMRQRIDDLAAAAGGASPSQSD